ncbi:MAG: hypothetical protein H6668_20585 [Ardenticatenaceae bacterium]|nr:hypothetical protein [Anaerolineales bacterium]MCB9434375.1 hypothetical protein [Ardenticatenaceae bacterium]
MVELDLLLCWHFLKIMNLSLVQRIKHIRANYSHGRLVLATFVIAVLIILLGLTISLVQGTGTGTIYANSGNLAPEDFLVVLHLRAEQDETNMAFVIEAIDFPRSSLSAPRNTHDYYCAESLHLGFTTTTENFKDIQNLGRFIYPPTRLNLPLISFWEPYCAGVPTSRHPSFSVLDQGFASNFRKLDEDFQPPIEILRSAYYYPFDKRNYNVSMSLNISSGQKDDLLALSPRILTPAIAVRSTIPNWDERIAIEKGKIAIELYRPLAVRILTVILLSFSFVFILLLLAIKDLSNFRSATSSMLFGLWGIQNILVPDYIQVATIVDHIIISFYVLLACVISYRFGIIPLWRRLAPRK